MKDENPNAGLRQEIVESQKTQADFLKWKLIVVGLLASFALGSSTVTAVITPPPVAAGGAPNVAGRDELKYLLALIPLLCGYVDLISLHLMIRIIAIGAFLKAAGNKYEEFTFYVRDKHGNPFVFEAGALHGSSLIFNGLILAAGIALLLGKLPSIGINPVVLIWAGGAGLVWSGVIWGIYAWQADKVVRLADQFFAEERPVTTESTQVEP